MRPITLVSLLVIVGCDQVSWLGAKPIQVEPSVPTPDSCEDAPQFATVAEPILVQWCVGCHTSQFEGSDRSGAPTGIDFDTYQGAFANAAAIDRVAGGLDGSTMPPAGGITDEERALLREWVSCGAQGEPEPVGLCDTQKWYFGSVLLVEGESLPDNWCDQYNSIGGGLFVRDGGDVSGIADCICEVDGQFMLQGAVGDELNFAELQTITGAIEITALHTDETVAAQLPQDIRLPKLTRAGSLTVVDHPALKSLYAPALSELFKPGVGLVVQRAAGDIDIHDLRTIAGPVDVQDNPGLTSIEFDQVFLVDGSFTLVGNDSLSWVDTRAVDAVNGAINVSDNA
ncbi:MAG: hypothetical protein GWP91_00970, partial [Rhodobacterales bacterium]|nr:hypothetical protein [Rhodobacterales bacterium]